MDYASSTMGQEVEQAIKQLEAKAGDARDTIIEVLCMLEMQDGVPWPEVLDKMSSLANAMSGLQQSFRKANQREDQSALFRSHAVVPQHLALEPDPKLQELTQGRIHAYNHDVAPLYLRTKADTEQEKEEEKIDMERMNKASEGMNKQIATMNKHIESLINLCNAFEKTHADSAADKPTYNKEHTTQIFRSIYTGENIQRHQQRPAMSADAAAAARQAAVMQQQPTMYGHIPGPMPSGLVGGASAAMPGGHPMAPGIPGGPGMHPQMGGAPSGMPQHHMMSHMQIKRQPPNM